MWGRGLQAGEVTSYHLKFQAQLNEFLHFESLENPPSDLMRIFPGDCLINKIRQSGQLEESVRDFAYDDLQRRTAGLSESVDETIH